MTIAPEDQGSSDPATTDLEELVGGVDAILWAADPKTLQFHYVSKGAERILGYPTTQWLEQPDFWVSMLHPDDRDRCVSFCREQIDLGFDHEFRYRAIAADGRVVWLRDNVRVEVGGSGAAVKLHGVMFPRRAPRSLPRTEPVPLRPLVETLHSVGSADDVLLDAGTG